MLLADELDIIIIISRLQYDKRIKDLEANLDSTNENLEKEKIVAEIEISKLKEELTELR